MISKKPNPPNWPTIPDSISDIPEGVFYFDQIVAEMDRRAFLIPFDRYMIEGLIICLFHKQDCEERLPTATGDFKAELLELLEQIELTISTAQAECLLPPHFSARLVEQWNGTSAD